MTEDLPATEKVNVDPLVGRTIGGKFVVERVIGAGAMGAVYRARQTSLDRLVAIKVMHAALATDASFAGRFNREAKAASRLDHPNVIRVIDHGQEPDGLLYIAMELLDGRDLFRVIEEDWPLSHTQIVDVMSQLLAGLAAAHDVGILHRDLKPENVMVMRRKADDGTAIDVVKVCDFGIAKMAEPEPTSADAKPMRKLSTAGLVVGTPEYMSPEQARGEELDARSDVYSAGVVLYQMLTGRLPFQGESALSTVLKLLSEIAPPPSSWGNCAAPGLEPACTTALGKRREERFPDARAMRAALRDAPRLERQMLVQPVNVAQSFAHAPTEVSLATSSSGATTTAIAQPPKRSRRAGVVIGGAAIVLVGIVLGVSRHAPTSHAPPAVVAPIAATVASPAPTRAAPETPAPSAVPTADALVVAVPLATASRPVATKRAMRDVPAVNGTEAPPIESSTVASAIPPSVPTPPIPTMTPTPTSTSTSTPTPTPPPPPPMPFHPDSAHVDVGPPHSNNAAATTTDIRIGLAPIIAKFTPCYRSALATITSTPSPTKATLHLETDDQGSVTEAHVVGSVPPGAAHCIEALARTARINVDTSGASADVPLDFEPQ